MTVRRRPASLPPTGPPASKSQRAQPGREPRLADVGESSSTDDEARPGPGAERRAVLKRTGHQRRSKFLSLAVATAAIGVTSFLEQSSVTPKVLERYQSEVAGFTAFAGSQPLVTDGQVDGVLVEYFNYLFFKGWDANKGEQILAGLMCLAPEFSRAGHRQLPRAFRCLKGWRRRAPGRSRRSWPLALWAGVAWRLVERGLLQMAVFLMISVSSYLRPNELMSLKRGGIIAPAAGISPYWNLLLFPSQQAERSKTNLCDVSIVMDSPYLQFLGPVLKVLASGPKQELAWTFTYPQYLLEFKVALSELGVTEVIVPYQTRHSGPSIDIARRYRTVSEAQRRGQWATVKSVQRYEKGARLGESWELLPAAVRRLLEACEAALEDILLGRPHVVTLPWPATSKADTSSTSTRAPEALLARLSSKVAMPTRTTAPTAPRRT